MGKGQKEETDQEFTEPGKRDEAMVGEQGKRELGRYSSLLP